MEAIGVLFTYGFKFRDFVFHVSCCSRVIHKKLGAIYDKKPSASKDMKWLQSKIVFWLSPEKLHHQVMVLQVLPTLSSNIKCYWDVLVLHNLLWVNPHVAFMNHLRVIRALVEMPLFWAFPAFQQPPSSRYSRWVLMKVLQGWLWINNVSRTFAIRWSCRNICDFDFMIIKFWGPYYHNVYDQFIAGHH